MAPRATARQLLMPSILTMCRRACPPTPGQVCSSSGLKDADNDADNDDDDDADDDEDDDACHLF